MRASEAPTIVDPGWNQYRNQVITAITNVEMLMQQLGKGLDCDGLTAEVAQRLGLHSDTQPDFNVLSALVRAGRPCGPPVRTREVCFPSCYFNSGIMLRPRDLVVGDAVYYVRERAVGLIYTTYERGHHERPGVQLLLSDGRDLSGFSAEEANQFLQPLGIPACATSL